MKRIFILFLLLVGTSQAQWLNSGSRFYWSKNGAAQKTDSIRFVAGTNVTLTQTNNTLTVAASGAAANSIDSSKVVDGSLINADIRVSTLDSTRIKPSGITQSDIRVSTLDSSRIAPSGITQSDIRVSTLDSSRIAPGGITSSDIRTAAVGATQLAPTTVTAGSYTVASITVDADGRITAASNGGGATSPVHKAAMAWFPASVNGADYVVLNSREEVLAFDTATAETAYVKVVLAGFTALDSVVVLTSANSTAGDSVQYKIDWAGISEGESANQAVSGAIAGVRDLGGTAYIEKTLRFTGSFTGLSNGDVILARIYRDVSISNDVAVDTYIHDVLFYYH